MIHRIPLAFLGPALAALLFAAAPALAATPTITATSFTWSSAGPNDTQISITNIPSDGTIVIGCIYSGPATTAKLPICAGGPVVRLTVTAGETYNGAIYFQPWGTPIPVNLRRAPRPANRLPLGGMALAGALLAGCSLRRRARSFARAIAAVAALFVLAGITACGGTANGMTPGVYQYTISSAYTPGQTTLSELSTTNITVTIP